MNLHFTQCSLSLTLGKTENLHNRLTLARSRPVNCHVIIPLDIGYFLLVVFRTKPISPAFLEILGPVDNWVTTLTFLGHVTSRLLVPTTYWCSIVTKPLSPALFEILSPKVNWVTTLTIVTKPLSPALFEILGSKVSVQCKSSLRMILYLSQAER